MIFGESEKKTCIKLRKRPFAMSVFLTVDVIATVPGAILSGKNIRVRVTD